MSDEARSLFIQILDRTIEIRSDSARGRALLLESYGHLQTSRKSPDLAYSIEDKPDSTLLIRRQAIEISVARPAHLLPLFDDDLVVQLQYLRPDLYFVHAAVVALEERAYLLPAPPGHGKSTLAWALLQHGLRYSSDELGPIDPKALSVAPYSRAICLKKNPSPPYGAPEEFVRGHSTLHLPVECLPLPPVDRALPLAGIFFPRYDPRGDRPQIERIGTATAAARLYSNALNPLAHPGRGLDTVMKVASQVPSFELTTSTLAATCELFLRTLESET